MKPTYIETISYEQGHMPLLPWHQQRFIRTQLANFGRIIFPEISDCITQHSLPKDEQKYKCRLLYSATDFEVTFTPYRPRTIKKLFLRTADEIEYDFKSANRDALNALTQDLQPVEEVLIVKKGFFTDSSFTNLAFLKEDKWFTPDTPLLAGVHRQYLLDAGILNPLSIRVADLRQYSKIRLFNAMMPWAQSWELPIDFIE